MTKLITDRRVLGFTALAFLAASLVSLPSEERLPLGLLLDASYEHSSEAVIASPAPESVARS